MSNQSINGSRSIPIEGEEGKDMAERKTSSCLNTVGKFIPIIKWFPKYKQVDAISDLIAGITLGLMIIPQSIAYAALAGLTAQYGLYSAFTGSLIYVFFGTIREVSIGPTSLMSLLTIEFTRDMPTDFVVLLGFLGGCVELLMGVLNLGFLVDFISIPVTSGFTSATSVIIITGQLQGLLGLKYKTSSNIDSIVKVFQHIGDIRVYDTAIGFSSIIFLLLLKQLSNVGVCCKTSNGETGIIKKTLWLVSLGRNTLLILITTIIASAIETDGQTPFILSGKVKSGLPSINLPSFGMQSNNQTYTFIEMCSYLGSSILLVPLIAVLANVSIAKAFSSGNTIDASQEMRALGLCNIFGGFVQSMPTCGAFSRSAVSSASGVRTPMSGIYSGTMTLLALSFFTPYFYYIPRASLAAVVISAVVFMIDYSIITVLWKGSKKDMLAVIGTFFACIVSIEFGLLFGILLNVLYLLHAWARPSIHVTKCKTSDGDNYILIKPDVGLYYPAIDFLRAKINEVAIQEGKNISPLVLDCESFKGIDYTAIKGIEAIKNDFEKRGQQLLFLRINSNVLKKIGLFGGIKNLKHVTSEEGIVANLFGDRFELTKSATLPILQQVENKAGGMTSRVNSKNEKDLKERESLLVDYKAVMKEFETVDKSKSMKHPASNSKKYNYI